MKTVVFETFKYTTWFECVFCIVNSNTNEYL